MNRILRIAVTAVWLVIAAVAHAADASGQRSTEDTYRELSALLGSGREQEAEPLIRAMIEQLEPELDPGHPARAQYRLFLGYALNRQGRHSEAIKPLTEAVAIFEASMGPENPLAMETRYLAATTAREAGQPEQTATLAGPLLETLREYVQSGRAQAAAWEQVPYLRALFPDQPLHYDRARVANVAALLGLALAEIGSPAGAEPALREAAAGLEAAYGPGHPELVRVREALEATALARGEALGRPYVGELGHTRRLALTGNDTFSAETLRRALNSDAAFILASHPAAPFAEFLDAIPARLRAGYLAAGFPDVQVEASYQPSPGGGSIAVHIGEGQRFCQGDIRVEGLEAAIADALNTSLLRPDEVTSATSRSSRIRNLAGQYGRLLPAESFHTRMPVAGIGIGAEPDAAAAPPAESDPLWHLNGTSDRDPDWKPGEPARFGAQAESPLLGIARHRLAGLGRPLADVETQYERRPDGLVDLRIRVRDPGPEAVLGSVKVVGNQVHAADDIVHVCGLQPGEPFHPALLDEAVVALWDCGRFFPFAIEQQRNRTDRRKIDVLIRVRELPDTPTLSEPVSPTLQTILRFARWLNEQTFDGDLVMELYDPEMTTSEAMVAWSPEDGLLAELSGDVTSTLGVPLEDGDFNGRMIVSHHRLTVGFSLASFPPIALDAPIPALSPFLTVLPETENEDSRSQLMLGALASNSDAHWVSNFLVHPAVLLRKAARHARVEEDAVILRLTDRLQIRLDPATGQPVPHPESPVRIEREFVRRRLEQVRAESGLGEGGRVIAGAGAFLDRWAEAGVQWGAVSASDGARIRAVLDVLLDVLNDPATVSPLRAFVADWKGAGSAGAAAGDRFWIPMDAAAIRGAGTMPTLLGLGALSIAEVLLPPDSWAWTLARELVSATGGRTQHTAETLDRLLKDPTIGPLGCLLCAQLVGSMHPPAARRFLTRAREQATADGFRNDWRLLANSELPVRDVAEAVLATVAAFSEREHDRLVDVFGEEATGRFQSLVAGIPAGPADQSIEEWIAPVLDRLWNDRLGAAFQAFLEARLYPPVDAAEVAVVVNGEPVPRWFARLLRDFPNSLDRLLPTSDAGPDWGGPAGSARAVWLELARQGLAAKGLRRNAAEVESTLRVQFPALAEASDEQWREAVGLSRSEFVTWNLYQDTLAGALTGIGAGVPRPTDEEAQRWYEEHGNDWDQKPSFLSVVVHPSNPQSPIEVARGARLAAAIADWMVEEPVSGLLAAACNADPSARCRITARDTTRWHRLDVAVREALGRIRPGERTGPLIQGPAVAVLHWTGSEQQLRPPFVVVKPAVTAALHEARIATAFQQWLVPLAEAAQVRIIEPPESTDGAPAPDSAFAAMQRLDSDSLVAALGLAYEAGRLRINEESLAVDCVLDADVLDAAGLVRLCAGLVEESDAAGARQCMDRARELDAVAAAATLEEQIARHAAHHDCAAGRQLKAFRASAEENPMRRAGGLSEETR